LELIKSGEFDAATGFLEKFVTLYGQSPTLEYNLAQLYNHQETKAAGLRHAWNVIGLQPDNRDAWDLGPMRSSSWGIFREPSDSTARPPNSICAIRFAPRNGEAHFELGKLLVARNANDEAAVYFKKYLNLGGYEAKVRPYMKKKAPIGSRGFAQLHNLSSWGLSTIS
jgi:tetratricopeptide (TPR) repeat protein